MSSPSFFDSPAEWRRWLQQPSSPELLLGFRKKASGKGGITYREALDEALCFGWIDGVRKRLDDDSYTIRFTPRKPGSNWSVVNLKRVEELSREGRMEPSGKLALEGRDPREARHYSAENRTKELDEALFSGHPEAWNAFASAAPSYRRTSSFWVMSAKRAETRDKRLATLIEAPEGGRTRTGTGSCGPGATSDPTRIRIRARTTPETGPVEA
ncbi:MAG: YdeI/OmpD-associated family protein [Armatimonadetes bacterium]|nr:YdeI/OmpD-associated family protein [Armatimonadota bacterium]